MLQRFIERYQLWCEQKAEESRGKNPLTWLAILVVLFIGLDIYTAVTSHYVTWRVFAGDAVLVAFLVLYMRRSPLAWLVVPIFGIVCLLESPFVFFLSPARYPLRIRFFSFCIALTIGIGAIAYGFFVRRRYHLYLHDISADAQNI
jgi:hypothetical protein